MAFGAAQRWVGRLATVVVAVIGHVGTTLLIFSGTERFFFADDGKIVEAVAVWRPADVAGQLWPRPSAPPAVP